MGLTLIVMGGLPGVGKSTVAEGISRTLGVTLLSVDPAEGALRRIGLPEASTGLAAYVVLEALAEEQLKLGHSVIVDAVNPVEAARAMWRGLAARRQARMRVVECVCGDESVHRRRVEARVRDIPGLPELTWERVEQRLTDHEAWKDDRITLDTTNSTPENLIDQAVAYVRA